MRGLFVFKTLCLQNRAPMAGGVPYAQVYRLVFDTRSRESFLTPRIPLHGVVSMLLQVRTGLGEQAVPILRHPVFVAVADSVANQVVPSHGRPSSLETYGSLCTWVRSRS